MKLLATKTTNWFKIEDVASVNNFISSLKGDKFLLSFEEIIEKRNIPQNAKLHAMFQSISKVDGNNDINRTKWQVLIHLGYYQEFEIKGRLEKLPMSTSGLNKKEFAELIDKVDHFAWDMYQLDLKPISQRGY